MADDLPMKGANEPETLALAHRHDFDFGNAFIRPSIRTIEGPAAAVTCEPRAMQVLLALIDAQGGVLSRDDLIRLCWDGRIVGDDAINRAIAAVRRTGATAGADFAVETIPRIGYRVPIGERRNGEKHDPRTDDADTQAPQGAGTLSRRTVLAGSATSLAITAGGAWGYMSWRDKAAYLSAVEQTRQDLDSPDDLAKAQALLESLVDASPDRAEAWGLLSYVLFRRAEMTPFQKSGALVTASEKATARALSIDAEQADALYANALLRFSLSDWMETETRVLRVIDLSPQNWDPIEFLVVLLQCVGRCIESREWLDRAIALNPMRPTLLFKKALKHWIFGETAQADRVIDGALQLWPRHEWIWNTRLMIYAFTGRPRAAISMLDDTDNRPITMLASTAEVWRNALIAMDTHSTSDVARARDTILKSAPHGPANAGQGVMLLSSLGELDAAYEIANGLLLARGDNVGALLASNDGRLINSQGWRRTQWIFLPATTGFRADPRFKGLCDGLGLLDYWRERGIWPDKFVLGSLANEAD